MLDVLCDTYFSNSLKESIWEKRGKDVCRSVRSDQARRHWMDFLHDPNNKRELFAFLTSKVARFTCPPNKAAYITSDESLESICSNYSMLDCNHEEAHIGIAVHILHALNNWQTSGLLLTWERITGSTASMPSVPVSGSQDHLL